MYTKYHRTYHLPHSQSLSSDDKVVEDDSHFHRKVVVVTEKMDGENTSMYRDYIHARSLDSAHHPSRDWVKNFWSGIRYVIPEGVIIRGENLYAQHSIRYDDLRSYFYAFSVEENGTVLSWKDTEKFCKNFGITIVPVLYHGVYDRDTIHATAMDRFAESGGLDKHEGYVVRLASSYPVKASRTSINKWVRRNHVQSDEHWMRGPVIPNGLKTD